MTVKIAILIALLGTIVFSFCYFSKKREIVLVLLSGFVSLCLAEVLLRVFYPQLNQHDQMFEFDSRLGWKFIPNKSGSIDFGEAPHYASTNSLGFRDDLPPAHNSQLKKIMVFGDSFVSNLAVRNDEVFTEVMQHQLANTSVLNFGVNGYSTVQEYLLLQEKLNQLDADVVVLVIYIRNDFIENTGEPWGLYKRPRAVWENEHCEIEMLPPSAVPQAKPDSTSLLLFYRQSHLNELVNKSLLKIPFRAANKYPVNAITPPELYLCRKDVSPDVRLLYRVMEEMLLKIQAMVAEKQKPLIFVLAPSMVQAESSLMSATLRTYGAEGDDYSYSLPNDLLMDFAKENNLQMIDLLPYLRSYSANGESLYNRQEQHWNSKGNRAVAGILLEYLRSLSLVQ